METLGDPPDGPEDRNGDSADDDEIVVGEADLTSTDAVPSGGLTPPHTRKIQEQRERVRGFIAIGLLVLMTVLILLSVVAVIAKWLTVTDIKDLLGVTLTPLVGLFGAITGFYFVEASR